MAEPSRGGFWTSLPGVLTGLAAVITALTGGWLAIRHNRADPATEARAGEGPTTGDAGNATSLAGAGGSPASGPNLIAADNGGALAISGSANWDKMIDGIDDRGVQIGEHGGDYGVFTFGGDGAARVEAFTTMVPEASSYNPSALELSYSLQSADGPFTPIGVFKVRDGRVGPDGRQVFRFPPVVARFLKVKLRPTQTGGPYVMAYEFGALGSLTGK